MFPQRAHSWVVEFQSQNIVHRNTRLCTYNVLNVLLYIPCLWFLPIAAYQSSSSTSLPSSLSSAAAAAAAAAFDTTSSIPSCYHHILATHAPDLCTVSSHWSRISRVAMYCVTVLCLFITYAPISSNPTYSISVSTGGYSQLPSTHSFVFIPAIRLANLC